MRRRRASAKRTQRARVRDRDLKVIRRVVAVGAVAVVLVAVVAILLSGGSGYRVRAIFVNASQIVTGDQVDVAGNPIGSVSAISLTPRGQAQLTLAINDSIYQPLHEGTLATVRWRTRSARRADAASRREQARAGGSEAPGLLAQLQPLAEDAVPTVRELADVVSRPGPETT